uniref:Immunoglobulin C1-set domain-containing protein n=1 Tax=Canis lupus dingo TaxID=286419 RepID=A0A8C0JS16_CANLU
MLPRDAWVAQWLSVCLGLGSLLLPLPFTPHRALLSTRGGAPATSSTSSTGRTTCYTQSSSRNWTARRGVFAAVSELGRVTARSPREFLALRQSAVDTACKHIFDLDQGFTLQRRVQPKVNVSPSKKGRLQHHNLLAGHVSDFSTGHIQVRCHPGIPTAGVLSTNLIHNGDWTFQILVMLEMTLQQGDIYTCQVEHPSLDGPVTVEWSEGTSDSAWSKMLAGVGGFVLGLIALLVSFILHFRSQQGKKLLERGFLN